MADRVANVGCVASLISPLQNSLQNYYQYIICKMVPNVVEGFPLVLMFQTVFNLLH